MEVNFAQCLDRPFEFFGLKGKWFTVFLIGVGCAVVLALIVGFTSGTGAGIFTGIAGAAASFIICMTRQPKIKHKQLMRLGLKGQTAPYISRKETLSRILYPDPRFQQVQQKLREMPKEN